MDAVSDVVTDTDDDRWGAWLSMSEAAFFSARGISKAFGPTRALIEFDIDIRRGDVRGLIGENGSGKSTFSSIVAGAQKMDEGQFFLEGKPYDPQNMVDAQSHGISMVIQEMGTIPKITVAANIFAGRLEQFGRMGFLDWGRIRREANAILDEIGAPEIRADMPINSLNFEDRKIVEIARAMSTNPSLLIIDETTTALATKGRAIVYRLIERMHRENKAVLFISHDLDELMEVCNAITVLRDGKLIDTLDREQMGVERMRLLMVGRELQGSYYRDDFDGTCSDEVLLKAEHISLRPYFQNISIALHKGEILGLGGLSDCGMHEIGRALFGIEPVLTGAVTKMNNGTTISSPMVAVRSQIAYISKDRDKESIDINGSIRANIALPSLPRLKKTLNFVPPSAERSLATEQIRTMRIKCRNDRQSLKELSGGNKQKVVFSKWLGTSSDVFILDCPTRGIDVGVKADMYKLMMALKREGKGIIMISEEMPELIGMSDRMLLFKNGKQAAEIMRSESIGEKDVIEHII